MKRAIFVLAVFPVIALVGCGANQKKPAPAPKGSLPQAVSPQAPTAEITPTDACASRLHDICEPLLLFYATHHRIPRDLAEFKASEGDIGPLICPVSHLPYVYDPQGKRGTEPNLRIVLYDATPVHSGIRWGIGLVEAAPGTAPVAKVVAVPDQVIPMTPRSTGF